MKRHIFAAFVAAVAAFAANTQVNAQVANRLAAKAEVHWASEGKSPKLETPTALASQKTYFYDNKKLEVSVPAIREDGRQDSLVLSWNEDIRRNATSGWALGLSGGAIQMAENFSPTFGLDASFAGKRILVGAGIEAAISKYNAESSRAGKSFFAPIFSARAAVIVSRFALGGYDNMGWVALGYEFKYILDKNENNAGSTTYETETEIVTTTDKFYVEGNSMCHVGFVEARFGLKHMGFTSLGVKVYAGAYNRYYQEGSRRKLMIGGSVSLYFSGAKKRSDADVAYLRSSMERGDFNLANDVINQVRATVK